MPIAVAAVTVVVGLPAAPAAHSADGRYVVMFSDGATSSVTRETGVREQRLGFTHRHLYRSALRGFSAQLSSWQVEALRADPEVAIVSPDRRVRALATVPVAPGDSIPPGITRIGAAVGANVRAPSSAAVAVVDTGIRLEHADLNAEAGVNCVTGSTSNDDQNGHGTHVAGVIAARNNGAGVTGVAPGTRVVAVKVLAGNGSGFASDVICGINWLVANAAARSIRVANMSFGYSDRFPTNCTNDLLHAAVCNLAQAGVVSVAAAGNDAHNFGGITPDEPASYPEVLTVTGMGDGDGRGGGAAGLLQCPRSPTVDQDDVYYSRSSYAVAPEDAAHTVAAPGVCVRSSVPDGTPNGTPDTTYESFSGTSAAAPHVSGTVALCFDEGGRGGPCAGLSSAEVVRKIVDDSAKAVTADNGFTGDPNHPVAFSHFGFLVSAVESTKPLPVAPLPAAAPAPAPKPPRNRLRIRTRAVKLTRGFLTVRLQCRGPARCRGTVTLSTLRRGRRKPVQLGRRRFSIAVGRTRSVRVRVAPRKRRLVRRAARIRARVTLQGGSPLTRILIVRHGSRA